MQEQSVIVIEARSFWQSLDLAELWRFRDLLWSLAQRDLKLRYRQTALGVLWVVAQPLLGALMLALVFGRVARLPSGGAPYLPFSYAGLLCWNLFSSGLLKSSTSLVMNPQLVSKVYFPRLILPLSTFLSTLVDFAIGLLFFGALLVIYRQPVGSSLLLLPLWAALALALALGCGLIAGALAVQYRDIQYILPVIVPFLLYASPVAYAVAAVPMAYRWAFAINPLTAPLEGFRLALIGQGTVTTAMLTYSVGTTAVLLVGGVALFRGMERRFADVI
jgi:lipopolysaccharide transport system permease protein